MDIGREDYERCEKAAQDKERFPVINFTTKNRLCDANCEETIGKCLFIACTRTQAFQRDARNA